MGVTTLAAIIHVFANLKNLLNSVHSQMSTFFHQRHDLLEFCEVSFLLGREEWKPFKERNHIFYDSVEVRHLKIPNAVWSATKRSAAKISFEESEYHSIFLGYVKADGDLPRNRIVLAGPKGNVEASFTIGKARQVIALWK